MYSSNAFATWSGQDVPRLPHFIPDKASTHSCTDFPFNSLIMAVRFPWQPPKIATDFIVLVSSSMNTLMRDEQMPFGMYSYEIMSLYLPSSIVHLLTILLHQVQNLVPGFLAFVKHLLVVEHVVCSLNEIYMHIVCQVLPGGFFVVNFLIDVEGV